MKLSERLEQVEPLSVTGRVAQAVRIVIEASGPFTSVGEVCEITREGGHGAVMAEVVGFREDRVLLMPLGEMQGIGPGSRVVMKGHVASVSVGPQMLGRIFDGLGHPLDGLPPVRTDVQVPLYAPPLNPLHRARITQPVDLGIRSINALLTCGQGQKIGVFAGSGVGKSVLLGMISRYTQADIRVIALVGERGREVKEFLERDLTPEARARSIVVVATSDQPPLVRIRGALVATAIAEYFRDCGKHVLLMMDSLSRLAYSQREVGLAIGEPPTTKGYTPSVFAVLPKLLERVGPAQSGAALPGSIPCLSMATTSMIRSRMPYAPFSTDTLCSRVNSPRAITFRPSIFCRVPAGSCATLSRRHTMPRHDWSWNARRSIGDLKISSHWARISRARARSWIKPCPLMKASRRFCGRRRSSPSGCRSPLMPCWRWRERFNERDRAPHLRDPT